MSQPPFGDPPPPARAASYGRGNQSAGRYRRVGQTPGRDPVAATTSPADERPGVERPGVEQSGVERSAAESWIVRRSGGKRQVAVESPAGPPAAAPTRSGPSASRWLVAAGFVLTLALGVAVLSVLFGPASRPTATGPGETSPWQTPAPIVSGGPPAATPERRSPAWNAPNQRQPVRPAAETYGNPPASASARTEQPGASPSGQSGPPLGPGGAPYYQNCAQARKAGVTPLRATDPGYSARLDKDGDGVACEERDGNDRPAEAT